MDVHVVNLPGGSGDQTNDPGGQNASIEPSSRADQIRMPVEVMPGTNPGAPAMSGSPARPDNSDRRVDAAVGAAACMSVTFLQETAARQKARVLKSLRESIPHTMKLKQLQKTESQLQKEGISHKKSLRRLSKQLYQILSVYALLASAIFTGVAQTSLLTCNAFWAPVALTALLAVGTLGIVRDKRGRMNEHREHAQIFQRRQNAVYDSIAELLHRGAAYDLDSLQPCHDEETPGFASRHRRLPLDWLRCLRFSSPYDILVHLFPVGLSLLVIFSCRAMLCGAPCSCGSPP